MEPDLPVLDMNKEIKNRCSLTFTGDIGRGCNLSIMSSREIMYDPVKIKDACEKILLTAESLSNRQSPQKRFQLVLIEFSKRPKNYLYNPAASKTTHSMLVILEGAKAGDRTDEIICGMLDFEPHELFHFIVFGIYPGVNSGNLNGGGWFEEGLANYCGYLAALDFGQCTGKDGQLEAGKALEYFSDDGIREIMWKDFSPGNELWKNRDRMKEMTQEEIKAFWKPIDQGNYASFGAFIYMEKKIGKERLFKIIWNMQGKHEYQDEQFYKDLATQVGFDIRKVGKEEIKSVLKKE